VGICGIGCAALRLVLGRKLFNVMALAGTAEDQKSGRQRETGSAEKKSHNASDSKRLGLAGARTKARGSLRQAVIPSEVEGPRGTSFDMQRGSSTSLGMTEQLGMKLKGLPLALL